LIIVQPILDEGSGPHVENPDPRLYREATVALVLDDKGYRGFLSRGRIVGRVRRLLGGAEWDFRKPYLTREEADHFRDDLVAMGLDARWEADILIITDHQRRWRSARIEPNRHGLYQVGAFGRAVTVGSGYERDWEEVVPLPPEGPLDAEGIATALDTGLTLGPAFDRIERDVGVATLIEALLRCQTDHARERLSVLLAHHRQVIQAARALPHLVGFLQSNDSALRRGAAYAVATIVGRIGRRQARAAMPGMNTALLERFAQEEDREVRQELGAALDVMGEPLTRSPGGDAEWFAREAGRALDFLQTNYGFEEPAIEHRWPSTSVTFRTDTTAVVATADWRDGVADVVAAKLVNHALPVYLDRITNSLPPSVIVEGGSADEATMADPRNREETRGLLQIQAKALRLCEDVLRGDFTRFDRVAARGE
jgi:hypothetical protein